MNNKKYRLEKIEEFGKHNDIYDNVVNSICYLAYFNVGERGWFLYETNYWLDSTHRVSTSTVKNVEYFDDKVIVETQNTKLTFKLINN